MKQLKTYIGYALWLALAACSSDEAPLAPPAEKEPLIVTASVDGSLPIASTRATGAAFEAGDQIVAYLQHVNASDQVVTGFSKSYTFTAPSTANSNGEYTLSGTSGPYWDDFSESTADGSKDIRTEGHGVRSYYAYCVNKGTASNIDEANGTLTWTLPTDFTAENLKSSDLLWSSTQEKVTYQHDKNGRLGLKLPFTHAMSKVSITIVASGGFSAAENPLESTQVKLQEMLTQATVALPTPQSISATNSTEITMYGETSANNVTERTFHAIVMPGSKFTLDKVLAKIENVQGNDYEVKVTSNMLEQASWGLHLDENKGAQSGVHYQLTVTINKQKIDVVATLADWIPVSSEATGKILFTGDIANAGVTNSITTGGSTFDLYYKKNEASDYATSFGWTYNSTTSAWTNSTPLYWENGRDTYYFRALAKWISDTKIESANLSDPYQVKQGNDDILWATTLEHTWNDGTTDQTIDKGAPVHPRTGPVPLCFEHALSKVTVKLITSADDDKQKVDLSGAKVTISPIATQGYLSLDYGSITLATSQSEDQKKLEATVNGAYQITSLTIPQTIGDGVKLKVTLNDNTTYSLQLKDCKIKDSETPITAWKRGNHYTYEITLNKEAISFVAYVEKWVDTTGSGNANLDWD